MTKLLNYIICSILKENESVVNVAIKQRSKFEGWLKLELAHKLSEYFNDVQMEYQANNSLVDIFAGGALIELKTPNTNYRVDDVDTKTRPITGNVNSIIHDIGKLQGLNNISAKRHIASVMFPIDDSGDYQTHVNKIISELLNNDYVQKEMFVCGVKVLVFTASC